MKQRVLVHILFDEYDNRKVLGVYQDLQKAIKRRKAVAKKEKWKEEYFKIETWCSRDTKDWLP